VVAPKIIEGNLSRLVLGATTKKKFPFSHLQKVVASFYDFLRMRRRKTFFGGGAQNKSG
jgi:hypothetical protein